MNRRMWLGLLVIGIATAASAKTFYVGMDGNDENPGNKTGPMRTIQKAANMTRAGDTILLCKGLYREPVPSRLLRLYLLMHKSVPAWQRQGLRS
jgi:hypothetical protein